MQLCVWSANLYVPYLGCLLQQQVLGILPVPTPAWNWKWIGIVGRAGRTCLVNKHPR